MSIIVWFPALGSGATTLSERLSTSLCLSISPALLGQSPGSTMLFEAPNNITVGAS